MIERQMEGGVLILQPVEVLEQSTENRLGGLIEIEEQVDVRPLPTASEAPKA